RPHPHVEELVAGPGDPIDCGPGADRAVGSLMSVLAAQLGDSLSRVAGAVGVGDVVRGRFDAGPCGQDPRECGVEGEEICHFTPPGRGTPGGSRPSPPDPRGCKWRRPRPARRELPGPDRGLRWRGDGCPWSLSPLRRPMP